MNGKTRNARVRALMTALAVALVLPAAALGAPTESWTQWGGPDHDFRAPSEGIAGEWPSGGPKKLWTRELGDG